MKDAESDISTDKIEQAVHESIREAVSEHARAGRSMPIWRNKRVEWIEPEAIRRESGTATQVEEYGQADSVPNDSLLLEDKELIKLLLKLKKLLGEEEATARLLKSLNEITKELEEKRKIDPLPERKISS